MIISLKYCLIGLICLVGLSACNTASYSELNYRAAGIAGTREANETYIDRREAKLAYEYLNRVRSNPGAYSTDIGANLKGVSPKPWLNLDPILTKVAEEKASDMATRNYFNHVNPEGLGINVLISNAGYMIPQTWIKNKSSNYFESIAAKFAGKAYTGGIDLIKQLILDPDVPDLGHRIHLLGLDDWNSDLTDIGIGFARNPNSYYRNYICVIIAKHGEQKMVNIQTEEQTSNMENR